VLADDARRLKALNVCDFCIAKTDQLKLLESFAFRVESLFYCVLESIKAGHISVTSGNLQQVKDKLIFNLKIGFIGYPVCSQ